MTLWTGALVSDRLGASITSAPDQPLPITDLFGMALRVNPKRPQLLVSTVLGKHLPTDPRIVTAAGHLLGHRVGEHLAGASPSNDLLRGLGEVLRGEREIADYAARLADTPSPATDALVLGYAETATALGHLVAARLGAPSLHSTRRRVPGYRPVTGFAETHSHATEHLLLPEDPALLATGEVLVLVDDELSTGRTALATIRAVHALHPRGRYLIAALLDLRGAEDRARLEEAAAELGARIEVVALASGSISFARTGPVPDLPTPDPDAAGGVPPTWPAWAARESGRHGFGPDDEEPLTAAATEVAALLAPRLGERVLVLGTEELMYAPLAIAVALTDDGQRTVRFSTTTRSPVAVLDDPGYAIRSGIRFPASDRDSDPGDRFAYNVAGDWTDIVVVLDAPAATTAGTGPGGLLPVLSRYADRVHPLVLPVALGRPPELHGPEFGSYAREEVTWLLKDLSEVPLEYDLATRERWIQSGQAHYAESLPVEYRPEPAYVELFHTQLGAVAERVATAVGTVAELARATRGRDDLVLVSLARAGTPIGVLMRRWAAARHGLDWPHFTISIVRDRGIDLVALRHLAQRFDPRRVLFVDGWTGKGAIAREFAVAIAQANHRLGLDPGFGDDLAVLADPGECVWLYGTRDDFLIPSACLNSTVSGLVSRTVLNRELIGPEEFHGAKCYPGLAAEDLSGTYLDAVSGHFAEVAPPVQQQVADLLAADRQPTWVGWAAAERLRDEYGLPSINLVKPGVGETTRVLLRRVPWLVVVNPDREADLRHIRLLAADRGVEVRADPDLPYSCVGLIRPDEQDAS